MKRPAGLARHAAVWLLPALAFGGLGCRERGAGDGSAADGKRHPPRAAVRLALLVVDDPPLARAISQLKAEWAAQTGGSFETRNCSPEEFAALDSLDADAVIAPSGRLGALVERGWVEPIPPAVIESRELAWPDIFETLAAREASWGGKPYAVPFGSPALVCWYRADLFEKFHRRPPATWSEYQELARFFAARENLGDAAPGADSPWSGALEPCAPAWAGRLLLARAAAYALHRDSYSTYFNIDTMAPLIDGPPFTRALAELATIANIDARSPGAKRAAALDPAGARHAFLAGHAAMALSWPSAARHAPESPPPAEARDAAPPPEVRNPPAVRNPPPAGVAVAFVELPGSETVYDRASDRWDRRGPDESHGVTLVGMAGRLGLVSAASSQPDEARRLLAWLSTVWAARICAASDSTTLFRHSQMRKPELWVDAGVGGGAARQYAQVIAADLSRPAASLTTPRIPGEEEYLTALDRAVAAVLAGEAPPDAALTQAAARWSEITERLGREKQRAAYRRSLGLPP